MFNAFKAATIEVMVLLLTGAMYTNTYLIAQSVNNSVSAMQMAQFLNDAPSTTSLTTTGQIGGIYLPSTGTLRILIAFVEF